jgi:DegV family protein with EDD domain
MSKVRVITDSSVYLPQAYVDQLDIHVLPLILILDEKEYRDGVDITAGEFYDLLVRTHSLPKTSQVPVSAFAQKYRELLDAGCEILVLPISSGLSGTRESALQALEEFPGAPIEVLETRLVSMALGFMVLAAARAAAEGASLAECKAVALEAYPKIGVYFTVENLKYLEAGGRINTAKRLLGTALSLKPVLEIRDGKIELVESVITTRKAIERMVQLVERSVSGKSPVRISVFHAAVPEAAQALLERLIKELNAEEGILSEVSPVIGSHVGPGTISVAYMAG